MLEVSIYKSLDDDEPVVHEDINYVSLISAGTYGPPALIAPERGGDRSRAAVGDTVLYINTSIVPLFQIERVSD
jgi:hypothetical protein